MSRGRTPTYHCFVVAPYRERQQPALAAQARKPLIVDEPVDPLEFGPQRPGIAEIGIPLVRPGVHFEDHGEHHASFPWTFISERSGLFNTRRLPLSLPSMQ